MKLRLILFLLLLSLSAQVFGQSSSHPPSPFKKVSDYIVNIPIDSFAVIVTGGDTIWVKGDSLIVNSLIASGLVSGDSADFSAFTDKSVHPIDINQDGASVGEVLEWDGTDWSPGTDDGAGGGEANTLSDSGTFDNTSGFGLAQTKVGVDLRIRGLIEGSNITITQDADTGLIIAASGAGLVYFTEADDNDTSVFTATGPNTTVGFNDNLTMQDNDIINIEKIDVDTITQTGGILYIVPGRLITRTTPAGGTITLQTDGNGTDIDISATGTGSDVNISSGSGTGSVDIETFEFTPGTMDADSGFVTNVGYIDGKPATGGVTYGEGRMFYDDDEKCWTYYNDRTSVSHQIGREAWIRAKNTTGSTITDGSVVYIDTASAGLPTINLTDADTAAMCNVIGIATEDITDGDNGEVTVLGTVRGINTSAVSEGSMIYVDTVKGGFTATRHLAPICNVVVGHVTVSSAGAGQIVVHPGKLILLSMLSDVDTTGLTSGDLLMWDGTVWRDTNQVAADMVMDIIGSPTFSSVQQMQNIFHSSGYVSGGAFTDTTDGAGDIDSLYIAAGTGLIRTSDLATDTNTILFFDWGDTTILIPADTVLFIGVKYNGGSPVVFQTTADKTLFDHQQNFELGSVTNEAGLLHLTFNPHIVGDHATTMIERTQGTMGIKRDNDIGGLILGEAGTRNPTVSAGTLYSKLNAFAISAIDLSVSGSMDRYYRAAGSGFTKEAAQTQWNNTQWDDGDGGLATISNNKYAVQWFYIELDGNLVSMYGRAEYNSLSLAEAEAPPSTLPLRLTVSQAVLIGRILFQENSGASEIQTVFSTVFPATAAQDHGNLAGLSDPDHPNDLLRSDFPDSLNTLSLFRRFSRTYFDTTLAGDDSLQVIFSDSTGAFLASDATDEDLGDILILTGAWAVVDDQHNHIYSNIDQTTSANWAGQVSDETGTGLWVYNTSPVFAGTMTIADFILYTGGDNGGAYDSTDAPADGDQLTWSTGGGIDWQPAGGGAGEANTLSDSGTYNETSGFGLAAGKVGTVLNVKGLIEGANITITKSADSALIIAATGGSGDLLADGSVPMTANWAFGDFDLTGADSVDITKYTDGSIDNPDLSATAVDSTVAADGSMSEDDINWTSNYIPFNVVYGHTPDDSTTLTLPFFVGYTPVLFSDSTNIASAKDTVTISATVPFTCTVDSLIITYEVDGASVLIDSLVLRGPDLSAFTNLSDSTYYSSGTNRTSTSIARLGIDLTNFTASAGHIFSLRFANDLAADNGWVRCYSAQLVVRQ